MYVYEKIVYHDPYGGGPARMSLMRLAEGALITEVEKYSFADGRWKNNKEWNIPRPDIIDEWHEVIELEEGLCSHGPISEEEANQIIEARMTQDGDNVTKP